MKKGFLFAVLSIFLIYSHLFAKDSFESDTFSTNAGNLKITFIGHGTLMFEINKLVIHIDPVGRYANYDLMPKADIILVTHDHGDHLDKAAIDKIFGEKTSLFLSKICGDKIGMGQVLANGDTVTVDNIKIIAVPAYNIVNKRDGNEPYHPKGAGNGYVLEFGNKKVYVGGDTENIPEMQTLKDIDIAFLPMNLPYTMTPEMTAEAAKVIKPAVLYPYHFGNTDTKQLVTLLKDNKEIQVRIRELN